MSNIYIQEPPTNGKILLHTTVGDIDIELWSKETPKACRNFVQLCLEGYYNGTTFHRVVKGFIVQGGDPNGDGTGGESIYGHPFKDEFHSRLRFVRRGLVAMANSGKNDNGSQFFFTLGPAPELQNKNTIFGKVTGNTLYNMLKLEEGLVDVDDKPIYPHKIISCKVLSNPFSDIVPRVVEQAPQVVAPEKTKEKVKKNFKLLSFGEEAEEDEAEMEAVNEVYKGQSKSSHDLANDPKLSSVPAINLSDNRTSYQESKAIALENIKKKFEHANTNKSPEEPKISKEEEELEDGSVDDERKEIRKQIKELRRELSKKKSAKPEVPEEKVQKEEVKEENSVLSEYHKQLAKYADKSKYLSRKGTTEREQQTLKYLKKFKNSLETAKRLCLSDEESNDKDDDDNMAWLLHPLCAEDQKVVLAKDANLPSADRYELSDPRNPITERRRKAKKQKT